MSKFIFHGFLNISAIRDLVLERSFECYFSWFSKFWPFVQKWAEIAEIIRNYQIGYKNQNQHLKIMLTWEEQALFLVIFKTLASSPKSFQKLAINR